MAVVSVLGNHSSRKGFIYTLEAVMAAALFFSVVLVTVPSMHSQVSVEPLQETVHSALTSLDQTGEIDGDSSAADIELALEPYVPEGYQHSVMMTEAKTETHRFESPDDFYFDKDGNHVDLQVWLDSASDLTIEYREETILENHDSDGYLESPDGYIEGSLSSPEGRLEFTGTGSGTFAFNVHERDGEIPEAENVNAVDYLIHDDNLIAVRVFIWQN